MQYIKLSNGVKMPMLGFGTFQIPPLLTEQCVLEALQSGYRLIDTAASYLNEEGVGKAIKKSNIPRKEIFITTKIWVQDSGYENTLKAFDKSLRLLGVDYIDLYLIHQPYGDYYGSWKAMEKLYREGLIKSIGVCNFSAERIVDLCMNCFIKPMINQVECHPLFQQSELVYVLKKYHCQIQAWAPLSEGQRNIFNHDILRRIAKKHHKTVAQIILRWHIQSQMIAIPKTIHRERMEENMDIWDFELDEEDIQMIVTMDLGYSEIIDHQCYATAKLLNTYKIHE